MTPTLLLKGGQTSLFRLVTLDMPFDRLVNFMKSTMKVSSHSQGKNRKLMNARLRFMDGLF